MKKNIILFLFLISNLIHPQDNYILNDRSAVPMLIGPGTLTTIGEVVKSEAPKLVWRKFNTTNYYELKIEEELNDQSYKVIYDSKFQKVIFDTVFSDIGSVIKRNGKYRWSVKANTDTGWTDYSPNLYFNLQSNNQAFIIPRIIQEQPEDIFIAVSYAGVLKKTIAGLYNKGRVYIPILELFNLLEINIKYEKDSSKIRGFYINPSNTYSINLDDNRVYIGPTSVFFTKDEVFERTFDVFFQLEFYRKTFGLNLVFDLSNLIIKINSDTPLPILTRILRERSYQYDLTQNLENINLHFGRDRKMFNLGLFDYNLTSSFSKNSKPGGIYRFGLAGEIFGGAMQLFTRGIYNNSKFGDNQTEARWKYVFDNKYLNFVEIGNLDLSGLDYSNINGVRISNSPVEPRRRFSKYTFTESTKPNWTVELYVNNELIDIQKADAAGNFSFNLPLTYGTTLVEMSFYGPTGEFYTENRLYQTPIDLLKPNEFNYELGAGEQRITYYNFFNANAAYGISEWLTNKFGIEYLENSNRNRPVIFNSLTARISDSYLLNITTAPDAYYKISSNAHYFSQTMFNIEYIHYAEQGFFNPASLKNQFSTDIFIPIPIDFSKINFRSSFDYSQTSSRKLYEFQIGTSASFSNLNPNIVLRYNYFDLGEFDFNSTFIDMGVTASVRKITDWIPFISGNIFSLRSVFDARINEFTNLSVSFAANLFSNSRFQISHSRFFNISSTITQLQFIVYFPFTQLSGNMSDISFTQSLLGSISYDMEYNALSFYERQQIGRSGAAFRMFVDANGNELFDDGEEIIKNGNLSLGTSVIRREGNGIIRARELSPYTKYYATIIEESIKNPTLIPKETRFTFETDPNSYKSIDIPFFIAGEISGQVFKEMNNTKTPIPGIKVHIENLDNSFQKTISTFSDGTFYYFGLKPGTYRILIEKKHTEILHLLPYPSLRMIEIKADPNGDIVEDLDFTLK